MAVETSDGTWRAEAEWPPADAIAVRDAAAAGLVHRRRDEQRHGRGGCPTARASGRSRRRWIRRAPRRRPAGDADVYIVAARRQPRGRPLRHRRQRPRDADQPRHVPAAGAARSASTSTATTGSYRPATAWACCSPRERRVVAAHADAADRDGELRHHLIAVPRLRRRTPTRAAPRSSSTPTRPPHPSRCPRRDVSPRPTRRSRCPEHWPRAVDVQPCPPRRRGARTRPRRALLPAAPAQRVARDAWGACPHVHLH